MVRMTTWAFRDSRRWLALLVPLNALLIATVLSGVHYVADLGGTAVMFGLSLWAWRELGARLLVERNEEVSAKAAVPCFSR